MLNASVGVQRVIGRLRRPRPETDPANVAPDPEPGCRTTVRSSIRSVAAAARLQPVRRSRRRASRPPVDLATGRAVAHARCSTPLDGSASACSTRLGPDRVVAIGRRRHRARRLGHQRLGRQPRPGRTGRRHDRRRRPVRGSRSAAAPASQRTARSTGTTSSAIDGSGADTDTRIPAADLRQVDLPATATPARRRARRSPRSPVRSSPTARCSSRSRSTRPSRTARTCCGPTRSSGRHPDRHRQQVRRLDDDDLVGQRAHVQGRPPHRPGPDDPAGERPRRDRQGRATRSTRSPTQYKVDEADIVDDQRARGPEPRRRPDAGHPRRARASRSRRPSRRQAPRPRSTGARSSGGGVEPPADPVHAAARSPGRSSAAATTSASTSTTATTRSTSRPTTGRASARRPAGR